MNDRKWEWPPVAILLVTYDRPKEIRTVIRELSKYISYRGKLSWHIADDGSSEGYLDSIQSDFPTTTFTTTTTHRKGWGANVNTALSFLHKTPYIFLNEDDYVPRRSVDLTRGVALLEAVEDLCIVRYDGLDAHALDLLLREEQTRAGRFSYLRILKSSPALNVYSNRPHLRHQKRMKKYGAYREGRTLGETESSFARTLKNSTGPDSSCLLDGIALNFKHIGESRQGTEFDTGRGRK